MDIKCDGGGVEKIRRRRNWSVDNFDSMEIRLGKSAKFDGAGVYSPKCDNKCVTDGQTFTVQTGFICNHTTVIRRTLALSEVHQALQLMAHWTTGRWCSRWLRYVVKTRIYSVAQWLGRRTSDLAVAGSIPGLHVIRHLGQLSLPSLWGR